jgi:hypothetical protein
MRPVTARLEDWPDRLAATIEQLRLVPFAWGSQDCCTLANAAVEAVTGRSLLDGLGAWSSEAEADALLAARGGIEQAAADHFAANGCPEIPTAFVQRGDIVLVEVGNDTPLGIMLGISIAIAGPAGLLFIDTRHARRAWAI